MDKNKLAEQKMVLIPIEEYRRLLSLCQRAAEALEADAMLWEDYQALVAELRREAGK